MNVTLAPAFERLLKEKLQTGEYRSADDILNAAMELFQEREEDRTVVREVNAGEPLAMDERFDARLEMLLEEAIQSGEPAEMTPQDWDDIEQKGLEILKSRRSV